MLQPINMAGKLRGEDRPPRRARISSPVQGLGEIRLFMVRYQVTLSWREF
jgi:hypothetical protein